MAEILKNKISLCEGFSGTPFIWPCPLHLSEAFWSDLACLLLTWISLMIIFTDISWCITHWILWTKQCCKAGTPNLHLCLAETAILTLLRYWTFLCIIQMQCASWHYLPVHHVFCRIWDEAEIELWLKLKGCWVWAKMKNLSWYEAKLRWFEVGFDIELSGLR